MFFLNGLPPHFLNIKIILPLKHCIRSGKILMFIGQNIILSDIADTSPAVQYEIFVLKNVFHHRFAVLCFCIFNVIFKPNSI